MTTTDRALALAKRLGVKTRATSAKGILAAIRKQPRRTSAPVHGTTAPPRRRLPAGWLLEKGWQGRARARIAHDAEPLRAALSAALRTEVVGDLDAVPNSYKFRAEGTVVSARRVGQAIIVRKGREACPHNTYGHGGTYFAADDGDFVMVGDVLAMFPPLPAGWRLRADAYGPFLTGPGVADYHPGPAEFLHVVVCGRWDETITAAQERAEARRLMSASHRESMRASRVATLAGRLAGDLIVSADDSVAAGNCRAGTLAWAHQHGIGGAETTAATLLPWARDQRVAAAIYAAYRRARS